MLDGSFWLLILAIAVFVHQNYQMESSWQEFKDTWWSLITAWSWKFPITLRTVETIWTSGIWQVPCSSYHQKPLRFVPLTPSLILAQWWRYNPQITEYSNMSVHLDTHVFPNTYGFVWKYYCRGYRYPTNRHFDQDKDFLIQWSIGGSIFSD
jgi:hypothetical protein